MGKKKAGKEVVLPTGRVPEEQVDHTNYTGRSPEQQSESDGDRPERYASPRQRVSALQQRKAEITRKRLETRAQSAETRPRPQIRLPAVIKPPTFYISPKMNRDWFPDEYDWWRACYFVNLIRWRQITWRANAEGYSQLHSKLLRRVIPPPFLKKLKATLTERGVVECDYRVVVGHKALGYRITPDYLNTYRVVCTDAELNRTIARVYATVDRATLPVHRCLKAKFDQLSFDLERALAIIARMKPARDSGLTTEEYRAQRREYAQRIADGQHWFSCDEYGRVHTPLTALEEELRCCLSVCGQPLVNIDLANSQPLIFSIVVQQILTLGKMTKSRILGREFDSGNPYHATNPALNTHHTATPPNHPHTHNRIKGISYPLSPIQANDLGNLRPVTLPEDFQEFRRVCEGGEFYEGMMTDGQRSRYEALLKEGRHRQAKAYRGRLKDRFYGVLFGENRSKGRFPNQTRIRFRQLYPTVARVLKDLKKRNYRHSSHLLQNYEATVFIHRICGRIMKKHPSLPLFTIHDSILTTPEHVPYVEGIIREEFQKLGVIPNLKKEVYE